jgi:hypothetical protein
MTNFNGMPEINTETSKNEVTPVITPDTQETELTPAEIEQFNKMEEVAKGIQSINPEETAEILKNNPEKAKGLKAKLNKFWAIANVLGDVVVGGIALGVLIKNARPDESWELNATNITALVVTTVAIVKGIWDLVGLNEREKKAKK